MLFMRDIPEPVDWLRVYQLEAQHFTGTDARTEALMGLAGALGESWPWGFLAVDVDSVALASGELRMRCSGLFPDGTSFPDTPLACSLPDPGEGASFCAAVDGTARGERPLLREGEFAPGQRVLPALRLLAQRGVWCETPGWSAPVLFAGASHPLRADVREAVGALAALAAGLRTTLRMPGADERAAVRRLHAVAGALVEGVEMVEVFLAAPWPTPARIGLEARRLALRVRAAAGVYDPLGQPWDACDQRGSLARLFGDAQATAAGLGLPFRAEVFTAREPDGPLLAHGCPPGAMTIGVECDRPGALDAARRWFEGAALAAPERVAEAMRRRVLGCARQSIARDPKLGVSIGPLLGLYSASDDPAWRAGSATIALGARSRPPEGAIFVMFIAEAADPAER